MFALSCSDGAQIQNRLHSTNQYQEHAIMGWDARHIRRTAGVSILVEDVEGGRRLQIVGHSPKHRLDQNHGTVTPSGTGRSRLLEGCFGPSMCAARCRVSSTSLLWKVPFFSAAICRGIGIRASDLNWTNRKGTLALCWGLLRSHQSSFWRAGCCTGCSVVVLQQISTKISIPLILIVSVLESIFILKDQNLDSVIWGNVCFIINETQ